MSDHTVAKLPKANLVELNQSSDENIAVPPDIVEDSEKWKQAPKPMKWEPEEAGEWVMGQLNRVGPAQFGVKKVYEFVYGKLTFLVFPNELLENLLQAERAVVDDFLTIQFLGLDESTRDKGNAMKRYRVWKRK